MAVMAYRTQDRSADYGFSIEFLPDVGWRIYIVFLPHRDDAGDGPRLRYQSTDRRGRRYVDWSGKIESLGEAKVVAELWAELTQYYQRIAADAPLSNATTESPDVVHKLRTDAA